MSETTVRFLGALLAVAAMGVPTARAQTYSFLTIADSSLDDFDPASMGPPSISDAGHVAFRGRNAAKSDSRVVRTGPGLTLPLLVVGDGATDPEIGSFADTVSVNNTGQVSVWATIAGPIDERIIRGDGGLLDTIAQASDDDQFTFMSVVTSINDSGVVAWQGELNKPGFPQGLFTGDGDTVDVIFSTASSDFTSSFAGPAINNAGQIAFRASTTGSGGDAIFRYDGGGTFVTIADSSGKFSAAFDDEPAINNAGRVAVRGRSNDISTEFIITGDGTAPAEPVVDTTGPLESINHVAINDSGEIAFAATFDDFVTQGIFTGPDLVKDRVIGTGDALDGSTVTFLSMYREGLNNAGQIAFFAQLADGRGVIMVATPLAGPCSADFNADGTVNSQDFFDYVAAFFAEKPSADFNADTIINSQDFFDFLAAFFLGC